MPQFLRGRSPPPRPQHPTPSPTCSKLAALACAFGAATARQLVQRTDPAASDTLSSILLPRLLLARQLQLNLSCAAVFPAEGGAAAAGASGAKAERSASSPLGPAAAAAAAAASPQQPQPAEPQSALAAACAEATQQLQRLHGGSSASASAAPGADADAVLRDACFQRALILTPPPHSAADVELLRAACLLRVQSELMQGNAAAARAFCAHLWDSPDSVLRSLALRTTRRDLRAAALAALSSAGGAGGPAAPSAAEQQRGAPSQAAWAAGLAGLARLEAAGGAAAAAEAAVPSGSWSKCYQHLQAKGRAPLVAGGDGVRSPLVRQPTSLASLACLPWAVH